MPSSSGLAVGEKAPTFTAPLVSPDGTVDDVALTTLLDDRPVLLSFYTNDFTPDCIDEWCDFRDFGWFSANDTVQVVGISKSRVATHKRFIDYLDLTFPLYSDGDLSIAEAFGVKYRVFKLLSRSRRSCFLIDTDRTIRYKWIGNHRLDPTMDTPPVPEIHEAIQQEFSRVDG
ncbi:MAG: redoxin domain-containing protein [Halobacteriales archaeon]|nr:redoxin domain-containing protein [Halobacteriales archaeon]